jgi:hypothetical protein
MSVIDKLEMGDLPTRSLLSQYLYSVSTLLVNLNLCVTLSLSLSLSLIILNSPGPSVRDVVCTQKMHIDDVISLCHSIFSFSINCKSSI